MIQYLRILGTRLRGLFGSRKADRELDEEMRSHLQLLTERFVRQGMSEAEATRAARLQFGNVASLQEVNREIRGIRSIGTLVQDLRFGVRMKKNPGFSLIAVLTLTLGIGANTAIFSVVNAVLLSPLPYREPDRLVQVWENVRTKNKPRGRVAPANFVDWKNRNQTFEGMAAYDTYPSFNLTGAGEPERIQAASVSASLFPLLGVGAIIGRTFTSEEEQRGRHRVVLIGHGLWQRRFGADPEIVGRSLTLIDQSYTVVGILPPVFSFLPAEYEIFIPMVLDGWEAKARGTHPWHAIARLKEGVTLAQAQSEMDQIGRNLEQAYPNSNTGVGVTLVPLQEQLVGDSRRALLVLLGAVAFVLLIACANVANLLLTRAVTRRKEMAVRAALGAGRARLIRQLLTESVLLAGAGGIGGLLLSLWGIQILKNFLAQNALLPRGDAVSVDGWVLVFTFGISLLTGLIFGLAPGLVASKTDLNDALKEDGRRVGGSARDRRLRQALIVGEVALALVLLVGAGLMMQSFLQLRRVDPGFGPENVLTADLYLPVSRYQKSSHVSNFHHQILERISALPGVKSAGGTAYLPFSGTYNSWTIEIENRPVSSPRHWQEAGWHPVTLNYFQTMGIPLISGRKFVASDDDEAAPGVAVINEAAARVIWPGEEPLGVSIKVEGRRYTIVGMVKDVRHFRLEDEVVPEIYFPFTKLPITWRGIILVVRTESDPNQIIASLRHAVQELDKDQPIYNVRTLEGLIDNSVARPQFNLFLLGMFAALALIMSSLGLYGVMSYAVMQRTHEIGIRIALGAPARDVLRMVVKQGMTLALIGVALGLAGALALTRVMWNLLFNVSATDPTTFALIALLLISVAAIASYMPARRATKIDPLQALRHE
jgi:predicted permease